MNGKKRKALLLYFQVRRTRKSSTTHSTKISSPFKNSQMSLIILTIWSFFIFSMDNFLRISGNRREKKNTSHPLSERKRLSLEDQGKNVADIRNLHSHNLIDSKSNSFVSTFMSDEKFVTIFSYLAFFNWKFIHLSKIFSGGRLISSSASWHHRFEIIKYIIHVLRHKLSNNESLMSVCAFTLLSSTNSNSWGVFFKLRSANSWIWNSMKEN